MKETIIILHGIFRTHRSMWGLARFLKKSGYHVLNLGYPSTKHALETLADIIHPRIHQFTNEHPGRVHFIGFSMGGLLIRAYMKKYRPAHLGRVVLIGTPNQGSEVADYFKDFWLYKKIYGPAGQQLITQQQRFADIFGSIDCEFATIAGNRTIDPISSFIIGKPNDGKVSIESTKLEGACGHIVIPSSHTFFPHNRTMWKQTLAFLQTGKFTI